jgi:hypothetical protein
VQRPTGVTILAVVSFLFAAIFLVWALTASLGLGLWWLKGLTNLFGTNAAVSGLGSALGIWVIFGAIIWAAIGYGLWRLSQWGRVLCIGWIALGLLSTAVTLLTSGFRAGPLVWQIVAIVLDVIVIAYLLQPGVRQSFSAHR